MAKNYFKFMQINEAIANNNAPVATQEPHIDQANKSSAVQNFLYGPATFNADNTQYYEAVAQALNMQPEDVMNSNCGNCAYNNQSPEIQQTIAMGMGQGSESFDPMASIIKGGLGYCQRLHFLTEAPKVCSLWVGVTNDADGDNDGSK